MNSPEFVQDHARGDCTDPNSLLQELAPETVNTRLDSMFGGAIHPPPTNFTFGARSRSLNLRFDARLSGAQGCGSGTGWLHRIKRIPLHILLYRSRLKPKGISCASARESIDQRKIRTEDSADFT